MSILGPRVIRLAGVIACYLGSSCASAPKSQQLTADLGVAQAELERARPLAEGTDAALACLTRGEAHLNDARAASLSSMVAERTRAPGLAQLAASEARCAAELGLQARESRQAAAALQAAGLQAAADAARGVDPHLKRAEAEQRRLEERVDLLQRNLEMTETELIRTKARLKGAETKADASSAIAEAQVLMRRLIDTKGRTANVGLCQEKLDRAENLLGEGNYGAAVFFAAQAQELLEGLRRGPGEGRPAPRKSYVVAVASANLRAEPSTNAAVVAKLPKGTTLEAQATRAEWVKVGHGAASGWVLRSLLE